MSHYLRHARQVTRAVTLVDGLLGLLAEIGPEQRRPLLRLASGLQSRPGRARRRPPLAVALTLLLVGALTTLARPASRRLTERLRAELALRLGE